MKLTVKVLFFLLLNFTALAIGGFFTGDGVASDWYYNLDKAPWTPPGWAFGVAWSTIMICYSFYMAILYKANPKRNKIITLYVVQLVFNVAWNPLFFYFQNPSIALLSILFLTIIVAYFLFNNRKLMRWNSLLILPYFIWLCIASSLNLYIVTYN
ncbi:MAG: tryptophan-rich sensory protein [Flavobacteriales bacterium]|nr:tryptophan-rich sensory protein [Flavobacteriales bacterium]